MKRTVLAIMAFMILGISLEAKGPVKADYDQLRQEILDLVGTPLIQDERFDQEKLVVNFTVSDQNEIVVISTSSDQFDRMIKQKLNYKKLDTKNLQIGELFTLPLVIKKS